jgi:uncharacterized coiled-coil DUF342 family protein
VASVESYLHALRAKRAEIDNKIGRYDQELQSLNQELQTLNAGS